MPNKTNNLRLFRPKIKTGVVQSGPAEGNYTYSYDEPILQQMFERTDAEVDMFLRLRQQVVPKTFWVDVEIVDEA